MRNVNRLKSRLGKQGLSPKNSNQLKQTAKANKILALA